MKKSLILIVSFILFLSVQAEGIVFFTGSFEEAKKAAAAEGKLIFMDAYASWCGPCKMMSNNVFPLDNVGAYFNDQFYQLKN
jgi:thiol:disulfide interchange protein